MAKNNSVPLTVLGPDYWKYHPLTILRKHSSTLRDPAQARARDSQGLEAPSPDPCVTPTTTLDRNPECARCKALHLVILLPDFGTHFIN